MTITKELLWRELSYDPGTGEFRRRVARCNRVKVGEVAGTLDSHGYVQIRVLGHLYLASRLAWLYMTGAWPLDDIDHINTDRSDNRWGNLRLATRAQNCANMRRSKKNTTGAKNIVFDPASGKYRLRMTIDGERVSLGRYTTIGEAQEVYRQAVRQHHGMFGRVA